MLGVALALSLAANAVAQDTGSITGTVMDPSGAIVPGAQVQITSPATGVTRSATTNAQGDYLVASLVAGPYNLVITAQGFKRYEVDGIVLCVAENARADARLQVGATSSLVTVSGRSVAQVETQSSELSGTITGKEISQLELNGPAPAFRRY